MFSLPPRAIDLAGKAFGYWTVLKAVGKDRHGNVMWLCQCRCGTSKEINGHSLRRGLSKSCRCMRLGENFTRGETIGGKATPEFVSYNGAKGRCRNPNNEKYPDYGGRGIEFRFESFEEFLAEVGRRPSHLHTLDRKDTNGHYEKGNVRWATPIEQSRNKRNNVLITANGKTQLISEWAEETGLRFATITSRIYIYGWCHQCAVTRPIKDGVRQCSHTKTS